MTVAITTSPPGGAARIGHLFLRTERSAHYHWRFGLLVAVLLAIPLTAGELLGRGSAGAVGALAAWFVALAVPPRRAVHRLAFLGRRLGILTATTALGVAVGTHVLWATVVVVALALLIPVPAMTITPVITFVVGLSAPAGLSAGGHIAAFGLGGAIAVLGLLVPVAASPVAAGFTGLRVRAPARTLARHVVARTAAVRYALQAALAAGASYLILTELHWPHATWVVVGVLTTLRPSWDATEARVVKRSIGMVGGAAVTVILVVVGRHIGDWPTIATIAVLGGLARPLRQYNYGFWPVLGTPVLLMLVGRYLPLATVDSAWRLADNLLGAAITVLVISTLWPHDAQRRPRRPTVADP